jgi:RNA-directed DNA polymerase
VGVIENGKFTTNEDGVPQGGPISPTIFNCVMNGVEEEIMQVKRVFPIRFADDIIIFSDTPEKLEKVKEIIKQFLKPRGMLINEEKTRVESIEKGVDFLGYNIKEYSNATKVGLIEKPTKKGILLVKPGKIAITNFKMKVKKAIQDTKSINSFDVIMKLNPIIRG